MLDPRWTETRPNTLDTSMQTRRICLARTRIPRCPFRPLGIALLPYVLSTYRIATIHHVKYHVKAHFQPIPFPPGAPEGNVAQVSKPAVSPISQSAGRGRYRRVQNGVWPVLRLGKLIRCEASPSENPKGIPARSPGLRGTRYPGLRGRMESNPNGVAAAV